MSARAVIVGWSHLPFGKLPEPDTEALMRRVARAALEHAELEPAQVDALYVGVMNSGFSKQGFQAALVGADDDAFRHTPATRVENACATGSAALYAALDFLEAGRGKIALVIGAEKMTALSTPEVGDVLLSASYRKEPAGPAGFAGIFGGIARRYFEQYGDRSEELAMIAAKNHRNAVANPYAQVRKDLGFEFCNQVSEKNPYVAAPLRRTDCALISDGAAALVVADADIARSLRRGVAFRARSHVNDRLPLASRDPLAFSGAALAWERARQQAGISLDDLDFVETHDCFTIAEMLEYEAMGLAPRGEGWRVCREGWAEKTGKLPINVSGGLKAKGHPIGATGVSMHVLNCLQLTGEASEMQLPQAALGAVFNMGGVAVANYVSILERVK
ncbi:MAG: acetyl-CoA acetyltransferase [Pirellulales bacterium]